MEITKEGAQSLRMKMPVSYGFYLRSCRKIARTKVKVGKTRLLSLVQLRAQEHRSKLSTHLLVG